MTGRLAGKAALIVGATGGIGTATALRMAAEGARLVLGARDLEKVAPVADAVRAAGGEAHVTRCDVAEEADVQGLVAFAVEKLGGLDAVYNNAAATNVASDGPVETTDLAAWDAAMQVNLRGPMLVCRAAIPHLRARGGGSIINVTSGVGLSADVARTAYGVSKAAVVALTRFVATQTGKDGIRCNVICPGLVVTPAVEDQLGPQALGMMLRHTLTPRLGEAEDIAAAVVYLASDEAAFVTGQTLAVDGGVRVHLPYYAELTAGS